MIATLWVALALAGSLDEERGWTALEQERPEDALDHAAIALGASMDHGGDSWEALWLYALALDATGHSALVTGELNALGEVNGYAYVVADWYAIEVEGAPPDRLAEHHGPNAELATYVLARSAWNDGAAEVALAMLDEADEPHELSLKLDLLLGASRDRQAASLARSLPQTFPERPEALLPLFGGAAGSATVRKARKRAIKDVRALAAGTDNPAVLYRARRLLARADDDEGAADVVAHLVHVGEPAPLPRETWSPAMRTTMGRTLGMTRNPQLPTGTPSEVREIALYVGAALRDMGRVQEAVAVYDAARESADSTELAMAHAEQLLRMGRTGDALAVAEDARRMASEPAPNDLSRLSVRGWQAELGAAWVLYATALAANGRTDEALEAAAVGAMVHPTADGYAVLGQLQQALGDSRGAFASFAVAQALGAQVSGMLEATWWGIGDWEDAALTIAVQWSAEQGRQPPEVGDLADRPRRPDRPRVGAKAPDWKIQTEMGPVGSESTAGRVVVMAFWASWCGPCQLELPELARLARDLDGEPITFVAISTDDRPRDYARFMDNTDLAGLEVARDPELAGRWAVRALPTTWIVDREGTVRYYHQGYGPESGRAVRDEIEGLLAR